MASLRQKKINTLLKQELSVIFREESRTVCMGAMITVTVVNISPDMTYAKVYVSIFGGKDNEESYKEIVKKSAQIRSELAKIVKNQLRKTPELQFYVDDSLDYAMKIDELLR